MMKKNKIVGVIPRIEKNKIAETIFIPIKGPGPCSLPSCQRIADWAGYTKMEDKEVWNAFGCSGHKAAIFNILTEAPALNRLFWEHNGRKVS
jgi:hypothetical protein